MKERKNKFTETETDNSRILYVILVMGKIEMDSPVLFKKMNSAFAF